jgi:hypothetical protein
MNSLAFVWAEPTPLAAELSKPIRHVSVGLVIPNDGPRFVTLWRPDETGLRLYTEMHDVAERREVGVLNFERVSAPRPNETIADASAAFQGRIAVSKLIIHESGKSAESGVILKAANDDEIIIVAGAFPYQLAILGVLSLPHMFYPEYPIDRYERVPMT